MVQNRLWEWLLQGFRIDLETRLKPRTIKDYCDHVSYFARGAQDNNRRDPRSVTKRDIQEFLHFVAFTPAIFVTGNGTKRQVQRDENSRWHHYFPLKRFFAWAVNEGYLEQNPTDGIVLKPLKAAPIEPYKPEHINAFIKVLDYDWQVATTTRQKMLAARDRSVLFLLLDSFICLEECSQLTIGDIDLDRQRLLVRQSKTGKPRLAGFGPQTKKALWRYLGLRGDQLGHDALWVTEEGHPLTKHENVIVFIDEAELQLPIEDTKARRYVINFLSLPQHRKQIFLLAFHFPRLVMGRYLPFFSAFLLKRPPYLIEFAGKRQNDALTEMMRRAEERFAELPGEDEVVRHTYVVVPRIRWQGMLENPLCSFWGQELSEVWAGTEIEEPVKRPK